MQLERPIESEQKLGEDITEEAGGAINHERVSFSQGVLPCDCSKVLSVLGFQGQVEYAIAGWMVDYLRQK